ncbi:MAG: hypothetical protein ACOC2M_05130 [bacterium]
MQHHWSPFKNKLLYFLHEDVRLIKFRVEDNDDSKAKEFSL